MYKFILGLGLVALLGISSCKPDISIPVVYAQTLPYNVTAFWNPNSVNDNVTQYNIYVDGVKAAQPPTSSCTATLCTYTPIPVTTKGVHVFTVTASNAFGESTMSDPFSLDIRVPGKVTGVRAQ